MATFGPTYNVNDVYVRLPDCNSKMEDLLTIIKNLSSDVVNRDRVPDIVSDLSGGFTPSSDTTPSSVVNPYASMLTNYLFPSDFRVLLTLDDYMTCHRRMHSSKRGTLDLEDPPDNDGDGEPDSDDVLEAEKEEEDKEVDWTSPYGRYIRCVSSIIELDLPALFLGFHGPCKGYDIPVVIGVPTNSWVNGSSELESITINIMKPHSHPEWDLVINLEYYDKFIEEAAKNNWDKWNQMQIYISHLYEIPYSPWHPNSTEIDRWKNVVANS